MKGIDAHNRRALCALYGATEEQLGIGEGEVQMPAALRGRGMMEWLSDVGDGEVLHDQAVDVDDSGDVIIACLVAPGRSPGEAPYLWCQDAAAGSLTVRRSEALSPVDGRRVPDNRRASQNSSWTSKHRASRAMARWHLGGIGGISVLAAHIHRVHQ